MRVSTNLSILLGIVSFAAGGFLEFTLRHFGVSPFNRIIIFAVIGLAILLGGILLKTGR